MELSSVYAPYLFAQAGTEAPANPPPGGAKPQGGDPLMMILMIALPLLFFWFIVLRPGRKQEQERKLALAALKKNDEVLTIGGIIGTVTAIKEKGPDGAQTPDDEITLRIDGAKLRIVRSAIMRIITAGEENKDTDSSKS
jgi:preprotein translocase subunit YajC